MKKITLALGASAAILSGVAASAQTGRAPAGGMSHGSMQGMNGMQGHHNMMAMQEYTAAMKHMDQSMMAAKGSSPDVTFARKMIAHHRGAIAMAQIQMKHGADADAKRIAQKTIEENTKGIAELEAWLRSHGA